MTLHRLIGLARLVKRVLIRLPRHLHVVPAVVGRRKVGLRPALIRRLLAGRLRHDRNVLLVMKHRMTGVVPHVMIRRNHMNANTLLISMIGLRTTTRLTKHNRTRRHEGLHHNATKRVHHTKRKTNRAHLHDLIPTRQIFRADMGTITNNRRKHALRHALRTHLPNNGIGRHRLTRQRDGLRQIGVGPRTRVKNAFTRLYPPHRLLAVAHRRR